MTELLPCPFCGSADINTEGPCYDAFMCNGCGASQYDQPGHAEAIAAWNTRASQAEIERLRKALTACLEAVNKAGGTALGVAMSGKHHPDPEGALMGVFQSCQEASAVGSAALSGSKP